MQISGGSAEKVAVVIGLRGLALTAPVSHIPQGWAPIEQTNTLSSEYPFNVLTFFDFSNTYRIG